MRGPLRASGSYANDFAAPYVSARLMLKRENPYDPARFWPTWRASGAPLGPVYANPSSTHSVYPPTTLVVLAPLAVLPWPAAWTTFLLLSTALYMAAILQLSRLLPGTWQDVQKPLFLALGLLLAPASTSLHVSNLACLSASLLFLGLVRLLRAGPHAAAPTAATAALLTLSFALKPTLAPFLILYLCSARFWKLLAATAAFTASLCAIFAGSQTNLAWLPSLRANVDFLLTSGVASLAEQNLTRSDRIDLQLPAYILSQSLTTSALAAYLVTLLLLTLWLVSMRKLSGSAGTQQDVDPGSSTSKNVAELETLDANLLVISALLVVGLLPIYQRFYSAAVLLLPILWAVRNLTRPAARYVLALCCIFFVNTSVLPRRLNLHLPGPLSFIADAHLPLLLLVLVLTVLYSLHNLQRSRQAL